MWAALHLLGQADPEIQAGESGLHAPIRAVESETSLSGKTRSKSRLVSLVTCGHGAANVPLQDINDAIVELRDDDVPSQLLPVVVDTVGHGTADVPPQDANNVEHGDIDEFLPVVVELEDVVPSSQLPPVLREVSGHGLVHEPPQPSDDVQDIPHHIVSSKLGSHSLPLQAICSKSVPDIGAGLDPQAKPFVARNRVLDGSCPPDRAADLDHVNRVQAGGVGELRHGGCERWDAQVVSGCRVGRIGTPGLSSQELPFVSVEDVPGLLGIAPKQVHKIGLLPDLKVTLPVGDFYDKVLPLPSHTLEVNEVFTPDYFVALHNITAAPGMRGDGSPYSAYTPNHLGARITLPHTKLKLDRWRHYLRGYHHAEVCQLLEFGFPVGVEHGQDLESKSRNHGSAYMWYSHVDKFIAKEVQECGVSGPFTLAPWKNLVISPLMTAHKKPRGRRTVFDATYGDKSINKATPGDSYLGQPTSYAYPKVEDYRLLVLRAGRGCFMWKRDLSRFFLQLPMDPVDFDKVGMIWRGLFFIFVGLAFGLVHSGLNGQRVTDAVCWILTGLGTETESEEPYKAVNYVDDFGGVERTWDRALAAFRTLGTLLLDLGLDESKDKAEPPTTLITFLGVEFDSEAMEMRVPAGKLEEIKSEIRQWLRRTTITKKELQSLLGKLFWVGQVVKHSRVFLGRMLEQLRTMAGRPDNKKMKLSDKTRKDITWWAMYLEHYNGVEVITNEDPIQLSYEQLLDSPHDICAGDATPVGGGAWHGREYWCCSLPLTLQDPRIPIHVKEFWVLIISAKLWGDTWTGRPIVIYCDNDAVCEVIWRKKPRDQAMLTLLREFLFVVVTKKFFPVVRKISTKDNHLADHISRNFDETKAKQQFEKAGLEGMVQVMPKRIFFDLSATW